ncbi:alpha/beta-hydrolase [Trematosphaeria pertusa]|uniref:Alpha/beta-hydrolase n=1 Tax=Trematosphaeria pertusa TaxID=390896 RepID=A0A6A6IIA5_9PLEO|nr:alpha/beta-hydrolase [Trematosphaeria pertusa]KAF2249939.1 alpha/beta-hydrolase [Trematosphaeria pertusa]
MSFSRLLAFSLLAITPFHFPPALAQSSVQTTGYLTVPSASLYYETYGTGPLLLFISGANGDADIWRPVAKLLAANYTVAIYDRRGFSRSYLSPTAVQNYTLRLETDATDAKQLLDHLSPGTPATVLGTSSGALVAMQLLLMYPAALKTLIPHEPPALTILPDVAALVAGQRDVYAVYRALGIPAALLKFLTLYDPSASFNPGTDSVSGFSIDARESPFVSGNLQYWFEREVLQYPLKEWDLDALGAGGRKEKLVLACGSTTSAEGAQYRSNVVMAERFGLNVTLLEGSHVGYAGDTMVGWARDLVGVLAGRR